MDAHSYAYACKCRYVYVYVWRLHVEERLVPPLDHAAGAHVKAERLAALVRRVELGALVRVRARLRVRAGVGVGVSELALGFGFGFLGWGLTSRAWHL